MKRVIAVLFAAVMVCSLAACVDEQPTRRYKESHTTEQMGSSDSDSTTTSAPTQTMDPDDFKDALIDAGYEFVETEDEDGNLVVDLKDPTIDDDVAIPVLPTTPIVKPTATQPTTQTTVEQTTAKPTTTQQTTTTTKPATTKTNPTTTTTKKTTTTTKSTTTTDRKSVV